jgi:hypothetical protein
VTGEGRKDMPNNYIIHHLSGIGVVSVTGNKLDIAT